jgi:hypothetical protein
MKQVLAVWRFNHPTRFLIAILFATVVVFAACCFALRPIRNRTVGFLEAMGSRAGAYGKALASGSPLRFAPSLRVETSGSFEYEQFAQMFSGSMPTDPNQWHLMSAITNSGTHPIEIIPAYLYSEASPADTHGFLNTATIVPSSYAHDFPKDAQDGLMIAPGDLSGTVVTTVALPAEQLDSVPAAPAALAGMIGDRTLAAALAVDAKPVLWGATKIAPGSSMKVTWEFQSIWASPNKLRLDPGFEVVHLGPIVRSTAGLNSAASLVVVRLKCALSKSGVVMSQSSSQVLEISKTLSQSLVKVFPSNQAAIAQFANAAEKIAAER